MILQTGFMTSEDALNQKTTSSVFIPLGRYEEVT